MEEEKLQKLSYINENIIEKGYNPEELSNFIIKKIGIPMENLNFEQLKQMIEQFKDQSLQDTYQSVKIKEDIKKKEDSPFDILYSPQIYDIKTSLQQKNKLLDLEGENKKISITISDPKKEKSGGFFSKPIYSYRVVTTIIDRDVRRTYNDFEWLREQLFIRYALRVVPPIYKENIFNQSDIVEKNDTEEVIEEKKAKYLNDFMNKILEKKIFRTSPILLEFLELDDDKFKKYRENISKSKYELNISMDNLKTLQDTIHCEMKKEDIKKADVMNKKYIKLAEIYQKLEKSIAAIASDFQLLENHMRDISNQFNLLTTEIIEYPSAAKIGKIYTDLNKLFSLWSVSYGNQIKFFKESFRPLFRYINLETQEISSIYKKYIEYKNEYEDFTTRINKRKEELFEQKEYNKWSLAPGTESQLPMFQNNKKIAFEKMLHKETYLLTQEKQRIACVVFLLLNQFDKTFKKQGNRLENYFIQLKDKCSVVMGDANDLLKMFSLIINKIENDKAKEKEDETKE